MDAAKLFVIPTVHELGAVNAFHTTTKTHLKVVVMMIESHEKIAVGQFGHQSLDDDKKAILAHDVKPNDLMTVLRILVQIEFYETTNESDSTLLRFV